MKYFSNKFGAFFLNVIDNFPVINIFFLVAFFFHRFHIFLVVDKRFRVSWGNPVCLQIDCLQYRLPTSLLPAVRLHTKIIVYSSIVYMHFCTQIKILETELLLPTLLLSTARLPACMTLPKSILSIKFQRFRSDNLMNKVGYTKLSQEHDNFF